MALSKSFCLQLGRAIGSAETDLNEFESGDYKPDLLKEFETKTWQELKPFAMILNSIKRIWISPSGPICGLTPQASIRIVNAFAPIAFWDAPNMDTIQQELHRWSNEMSRIFREDVHPV